MKGNPVSDWMECREDAAGTQEHGSNLVNRLTQELAQLQRAVAAGQRKVTATTRSLEARTQELGEARVGLALLLATLDASHEGILAMGQFGRAMHFNARFVDIWGIARHQAESLNDAALLALQLTQVRDPARFLDFVQSGRARPDEERRETIELTDGRMLDCHVMPQKVRGRRVGTVTSYRDITERGKLERLLALLEAEMPQRVADARAALLER